MNHRRFIRLGIFVFWLAGTLQAVSQEPAFVAADSLRSAAADSGASEEVALEDIHIEAVIEKPAVTLIPKRIPPEVGDAPALTRSFDLELKGRPAFLDEVGRESEAGARMRTAKKNLAKEKN